LGYNPTGSRKIKAYSFKVSIGFFRFFNYEDQVELKGFFFSRGFENESKKEQAKCQIISLNDKEGKKELLVRVSVLPHHLDKIFYNSEIVLVVRLKLNNSKSMYFPYNLNGNERYLGAKVGLKDHTVFTKKDFTQIKTVTINTLNKLLTDNDVWK